MPPDPQAHLLDTHPPMIPTFTPASDIVPENLDATRWEDVGPLYQELLDRPLHCQNCLQQMILDRSEIDAAVSEAGSVLYINMTCQTDDAAAGKAYMDFVENVQPRLKEISFEIDKKFAASPFLKDLDQKRYQVYLRDLKVAIDLFRPENVPIETELTRLDQEYSQICGGLMVNFQGQERTLPQMSRFNEEPDRAVRELAWRAVADRRVH